jgi:branched-chain amino acid aminotransferase
MSPIPNQRVAYFNGAILPESDVRVSFRDRGFKFGDAVFDLARTFGGKPFKLKEHVERLYEIGRAHV